jgi:Cytochrome P450
VLLLYGSANRDEQRFPRAAEYDPHRPNLNDHIAFGCGLHYCLGAYLARLDLRVVLEPDQEITHSSTISLRGLDHLMATVPADTSPGRS